MNIKSPDKKIFLKWSKVMGFNYLLSILSMPFMIRALVGGMAICLCASLLGVTLVLKRYSMIGDGLSHVGFAATAVATVLGVAPLAVSVPVVIACAFLLLFLNENTKIKGDAAIALLSTGALAIGVIAVSTASGINADFNSFMFGSILGMSNQDVVLSVFVCTVVLVLYVFFYNKIFSVTFDETFSKATGVKIKLYNSLIAVLCALVIVLGMRLMGALLISSLIIFPALTAMRVYRKFISVCICSVIVSLVCFVLGIVISCLFNLPTGASIVCTNILTFLIFTLIGYVSKR